MHASAVDPDHDCGSLSVVKPRVLQSGQIYWVDNVPPLDGSTPGRHPVVIVDDDNLLSAGADPVVVLGVTTSLCDDADKLRLPNQEDDPGCSIDLPRSCVALPRWYLLVERHSLDEYVGKIGAVLVTTLKEAVEERLNE